MSKYSKSDIVTLSFVHQFCFLNKDKTMDDALNEWAAYKNHLIDCKWFKHPDDYNEHEFVKIMRPILEENSARAEFIGCNGKYNK